MFPTLTSLIIKIYLIKQIPCTSYLIRVFSGILSMGWLGEWWYYTETATKVLIIILIALLVIIVTSPHLRPLRPIAKALGLIETKEVYRIMNNTTYVTKYINQAIPIYINRAIFIPMNNVSSGDTWWNYTGYLMGTGWCWGRLLVLPNNTAWFITTWITPEWLLQEMGLSTCGAGCYNFSMPYGTEHLRAVYLPIYLPINGTINLLAIYGMSYTAVSNVTVNYPFPGFTVVVIGDVTGQGPIPVVHVVSMSNNDVIVSGLASNVTLALNTTYYGYLVPINSFNGSLSVLYIVPCRLDTIYITNPQASLNITVPFSTYVASVHNYVYYGKLSPEPAIYRETFGWWVWRTGISSGS